MKITLPTNGYCTCSCSTSGRDCAVSAYAVPETDAAGTSTAASDTTAANESDDTLWKAEISDYDSSLSLVQYEEVKPSEEQAAAIQDATTPRESTAVASSMRQQRKHRRSSLYGCLCRSGQFAFTTYGYGHCVGMSQNGANYYATYGGYDYQSILFHYFPVPHWCRRVRPARSLQTV